RGIFGIPPKDRIGQRQNTELGRRCEMRGDVGVLAVHEKDALVKFARAANRGGIVVPINLICPGKDYFTLREFEETLLEWRDCKSPIRPSNIKRGVAQNRRTVCIFGRVLGEASKRGARERLVPI